MTIWLEQTNLIKIKWLKTKLYFGLYMKITVEQNKFELSKIMVQKI